VVLGGKWGAETAVSLAREKDVDNVTLVEESDDVATVLDGFRQAVIKGYLQEENVRIITDHKAVEIKDQGVRLMDRSWNSTLLPADTVIVSMGRVAKRELAEALTGKVSSLHCIGDCNRPNEWPILFAMEEANFVALRL
jgi:pyruvate/2-oxoglutarate dehydrogenase complex dihydrolipoamide dehydrogenase (E3) component